MASTKEKKSGPKLHTPQTKTAQTEPDVAKATPSEAVNSVSKSVEEYVRATRMASELAADVAERLRLLGLDGLTTREQFREAVEALDLTTVEGATKFGTLMTLAKDFASLTPPIDPNYTSSKSKSVSSGASVDNPTIADDDKAMTDLTRQEVDAKLAASEAKVDARLTNFDTSIKTGFAELRTEFAGIRTDMAKQSGDMRTEMAELRAEMHKGTIDIIKWVIGFGIASLGAIFAFARMTDKPPAQAAVQPAPIVITVPSAVPVPTAPTLPAPK